MTSIQIVAAVVVCIDIGIVAAALFWPQPHDAGDSSRPRTDERRADPTPRPSPFHSADRTLPAVTSGRRFRGIAHFYRRYSA